MMNKEATAKAILEKIESTVGMSIRIEAFKKKMNDSKFIKEAAKFVGVQIIYRT